MFKKIRSFKEKIESNKPLMITYKIIKWIIGIFLVMILAVILFQKVSNNELTINGIRIFNVASGSMVPEYKVGDIIFVKEVPKSEIKIGDNITYLGNKNELAGVVITHKVNEIKEVDGITYYITKGVANEFEDPTVSYDQIYGKVVYRTVILSFISRIMYNTVAYYGIFVVICIAVSIQIVRIIFESKELVEECAEEETDDEEESNTKIIEINESVSIDNNIIQTTNINEDNNISIVENKNEENNVD